jgi:hypothetical protein
MKMTMAAAFRHATRDVQSFPILRTHIRFSSKPDVSMAGLPF